MGDLVVVFGVTIGISIVVAVILLYVSRLSSQPKKKDQAELDKGLADIIVNEELRKAIFNEIHEVVGSERICREISGRVSTVFENELTNRIDITNREVDSKYKSIITDKTRSEEIAWSKYKGILTEQRETEAVIRSIAEGLVVVNSAGNVVMMNPAAEKMLGISKKDKMGKPILEDLDKEQFVSLIKDNPDGKDRDIEMVSSEDETKRILRSSNSIIEDQKGQAVGIVSVLSDVTKQREIDEIKKNFVSNVTHELRTPLVTTQKALSLLHDKSSGVLSKEDEEDFLSLAENNLNRLNVLINDLLDLSKLEDGKLRLKREPVAIVDIIDDCVKNLSSWAETKSITVERSIPEDIPEVNIDPKRITQVMINLVGNAIKFTPEKGKIDIDVLFNKATSELTVSVKDDGIGIDKDNLSKIFERFYQAGERSPINVEGTGIGLSIVKDIVELHGGSILAESDDDKGTRFMFKINCSPS